MSPQYAQVSGGKMHRLLADVDNASAFRPTRVACGRTVEPVNYFDSRADALAYCGNRGEYLCSQCACRHDVSLYGRCADCGMTCVGLYMLRLARAEAVGRRDARRPAADLIDYYMPPVCACGELATATHRCTPAEFLSLSGRVNGGIL